MVDARGNTVSVNENDIAGALAAGFRPQTAGESAEAAGKTVLEEQYGGVGGKVAAFGAGALRGATLGGSDLLLDALGGGEDLQALREVNPITSTVGEIGGGLASSFAAPTSLLGKMPGGYLARAGNEAQAAAHALGGIKGTAASLAAMGGEAAAQNAGMYLSDVALGDRKLTAEGLAGALGTGFVFGSATGGAVTGIVKGSMAARRLFSSVMDGGEDAAREAAGTWERKSTEIFDANRATLDAAKQQLDEATAAAQEAQIAQQRARQTVANEKLYASRATPDEPFVPQAPEPIGPQPYRFGTRAGAAAEEVAGAPNLAQAAPVASKAPTGIPDYAGLTKHLDSTGKDYLEQTVPASEIADRGYYEPPGGHLDPVRTANAKKAIAEGQREAIKLGISENGKIVLMDGRHRLAAAVEAGAPVKVKWTTAFEPATDDVLRGAAQATAQAPAASRFAEALSDAEFDAYKTHAIQKFGDEFYGSGMHYSKYGDESMNGALRAGKELTGADARASAAFEEALQRPDAKLPRDTTLYRGVNGEFSQKRFARLKPGDVVEDPAYLSTAASASSKVRNEDIVFEIAAPRGTPALPIASKYSSEGELLLSRGTKMRVISNDLHPYVPTKTRHTYAVEHEVLPDMTVRVKDKSGKWTSHPPTRTIKAEIVPAGSGAAVPALSVVPPPAQKLATAVAEAEDAESVLMQKLMGTKSRVDAGESISQIGAGARAQPTSPKQLTDTLEDLVERAAEATDIESKQSLLRQASVIEDQLATMPKSFQALNDIDSITQAMGRYERAMADVADEMGDAAHPLSREIADGVRKAETEAERRMLDRATHAIDDHAEQYGPFENVGPAKMSGRERIAYAKQQKLEADAAAATTRADQSTARQAYSQAKERAAVGQQAIDTIGLPKPPSAPAPDRFGALKSLGTGLELASMAGIPGLPKPSDLPIIGPVIGLWLKARALKSGADRLMGRVPASGNARVAALANQTRDRAAKVVDKMLGLVERAGPAARTVTTVGGPRLVDAVRDRVFDSKAEAPAKDASLQDHVAARIREIGELVSNPALITAQVRRELRDVADPDTIAAAIQFRTNQLQYLHDNAPKETPPSPFQRTPWKPTKQEAADFARRFAVAMDPVVALEQVEQRSLTPEAAEAFRAVYPLLFAQTQERLMTKAVALKQSVPRQQLIRMSILFDIPLDSSLEAETLASFQAALSTTSPADPAQQPAPPPSPSLAGTTNLTAIYQTPSDRRAAM